MLPRFAIIGWASMQSMEAFQRKVQGKWHVDFSQLKHPLLKDCFTDGCVMYELIACDRLIPIPFQKWLTFTKFAST